MRRAGDLHGADRGVRKALTILGLHGAAHDASLPAAMPDALSCA